MNEKNIKKEEVNEYRKGKKRNMYKSMQKSINKKTRKKILGAILV